MAPVPVDVEGVTALMGIELVGRKKIKSENSQLNV
jgi:hypothetical protein